MAGILAGDDLANPIIHDPADGMAPASKLVIQDAGFAADDCGDLPGIGCPVTDLIPVFQQAYDQGARTHSNSWGDNENASVSNTYTDASEDVDEFMWNKPDLLILDDMGMKQLPKRSGEYLFEIIMRRHELKSTIMTSNRPLEDWGKLIGDVPTATAILDRMLEGAEIIQITGKSYRIGRRRGKSEE